jgi:hypothetical protein
MLSESKLKGRKHYPRYSQEPTDGYCPENPNKGHAHGMSDWSYWAAGNPDIEKHPHCSRCGYIDRSRILDSWEKSHAVD